MPDDDHQIAIFDGELPLFEQRARSGPYATWSARDLAKWLGYSDFEAFKPVLKKAQEVLLILNIDITEHFSQETTTDAKGKERKDVRMTRCACYLAAMNANPKKVQVARAQVYFSRLSEACQCYLDDPEPIERILIRKEVSKHELTLSRTAKKAGVQDFAAFRSKGYMGLYNLTFPELKAHKGIPEGRTPLDFMGKDELAANLFRITQTEAKIQREKITGQRRLEDTAEGVGKAVRDTMYKISGQRPENLPPHEDIERVRKGIKGYAPILKSAKPSDLTELPPVEPYLEFPEEND